MWQSEGSDAKEIVRLKRHRQTVKIGRRFSVEEVEEAVEEYLCEATSS